MADAQGAVIDAFDAITQRLAALEKVVKALLVHLDELPARDEFRAFCLSVAAASVAYEEYLMAEARLAEEAMIAVVNQRTAGGLRDESITEH